MRVRYWTVQWLCDLTQCLRDTATKTDDGKLALAGEEGMTKRVCQLYWKRHDTTPQYYFIMKAISTLVAAGVINVVQPKGKAALRYIEPDSDKTQELLKKYAGLI